MEIVNPGGLAPGLDEKDFGKVSIRRNEIIADLFHRMKKVEKMGSGIKRMRDAIQEAGLEPAKFELGSFFRAIFYRPQENVPVKVPDKVTIGVTKKGTILVTDHQAKIIEEITKHPRITIIELSNIVGISPRKIKENIKKLKDYKILLRHGNNRTGYWEIVENKNE